MMIADHPAHFLVKTKAQKRLAGQDRVHAHIPHFLNNKRTPRSFIRIQIAGEFEFSYVVEESGKRDPVFQLFRQVQFSRHFTGKPAHIYAVRNFLCKFIINDLSHNYPRS